MQIEEKTQTRPTGRGSCTQRWKLFIDYQKSSEVRTLDNKHSVLYRVSTIPSFPKCVYFHPLVYLLVTAALLHLAGKLGNVPLLWFNGMSLHGDVKIHNETPSKINQMNKTAVHAGRRTQWGDARRQRHMSVPQHFTGTSFIFTETFVSRAEAIRCFPI